MRIRTLLIGGTIASAATVAAVVGYLAVAARTIDAALARDDATGAVIVALFEQSEILSDYLLHPGQRARDQWLRQQDAIGLMLDRIAASHEGDLALLDRMRRNHRVKRESFALLLESFASRMNSPSRFVPLDGLQEHRVGQLRLATQTMFALAARLAGEAGDELTRTRSELAWGLSVLVISMVVMLGGAWFLIGWRVVKPITRLQEGIREFRGGKVAAWKGIRADDEIGDVAHAFERMADNLNTVMVSRDELAKEVETRRRAEQSAQQSADTLKARTAELDAVNRELETFAYSVSHDLRAPLRSMAGFCQALVEDYGDRLDETARDYVQRIAAASRRMGRLIDDLLALSRVTRAEVNRSQVDLSDMAETIAAQLRQTEPDRNVEFRIQPGLTTEGDETLLHTVLENLLGNAWKYSSKRPRATIEFGVAINGGEPSYFVRDDGIGFDMAHADQLFKPFQRLHRSAEFEGTGIGLASAANIVHRHGGRIWAEASPGAGTTMRFTLSP